MTITKMNFFKKYLIFVLLSVSIPQLVNYDYPESKDFDNLKLIKINQSDEKINLDCKKMKSDRYVCKALIEVTDLGNKLFQVSFDERFNDNKFFIIDSNDNKNFKGPYHFLGNELIIRTFNSNFFIIEFSTTDIIDKVNLVLSKVSYEKNVLQKNKFYKKNKFRDEPIILVTGYWPPTNEMIRHFSQNQSLNPEGWQGDNWENRGYDVISFFPEFSDPDCLSCGQGYGDLEVDYQDTSNDFWPIFNEYNPIAVITFSRGYMDQSWELEFNAYNRTNWFNDFTAPFLPTPNPPDSDEVSFYLRNSNLPMEQIVNNISNLEIGLNPYIDFNGDPGRYVSEFMAYHGTWYRDLNQFGNNNCISSGHIHVGGNINLNNAKIATEESLRVLIDYINSFIYIPGDLNEDETIDILDLVTIVNYILGDIVLSDIQTYAADLNEDSLINIQDIIIIINLILSS